MAYKTGRKPNASLRIATLMGETYYQGLPCKHGHSGVRYTSNRRCVACSGVTVNRDEFAELFA